MWKQL
jgi:hypothetical protein